MRNFFARSTFFLGRFRVILTRFSAKHYVNYLASRRIPRPCIDRYEQKTLKTLYCCVLGCPFCLILFYHYKEIKCNPCLHIVCNYGCFFDKFGIYCLCKSYESVFAADFSANQSGQRRSSIICRAVLCVSGWRKCGAISSSGSKTNSLFCKSGWGMVSFSPSMTASS